MASLVRASRSNRHCQVYQQYRERSERWQKGSLRRLSNVVVALNEFADSVRADLIGDYFTAEGRFMVIDSFGVTNEGQATQYIPKVYVTSDDEKGNA